MKGLLIKDFYTIFKQMKVFLVFIVLFAFVPDFSSLSFAIIFATLLPMTSVAYDERSKWNRLAAMMPYSAADIAVSKYLLGYIVIFATTVLCCFGQAVAGIFTHTALTAAFFEQLVLLICAGLVIDALELPVIIKLGVEKGRMFMVLFAVALSIVGTSVASKAVKSMSAGNADLMSVMLIGAAAAVILNALSIPLSIKLYKSSAK